MNRDERLILMLSDSATGPTAADDDLVVDIFIRHSADCSAESTRTLQ